MASHIVAVSTTLNIMETAEENGGQLDAHSVILLIAVMLVFFNYSL